MFIQDIAQSTNHLISQSDEAVWSAVLAWATAKLLEVAKRLPWFPMAKYDAETVNRVVSWLAAAGVAAGLTFTFDPDTTQFVVQGTVTGLLAAAAHGIRQVMFQEIAYKKFIAKPSPAPAVDYDKMADALATALKRP